MKAELEKIIIKLADRTLELTAEEYEALKSHFEALRLPVLKEYIPYPIYPYPQPYYPIPWWGSTTSGTCIGRSNFIVDAA